MIRLLLLISISLFSLAVQAGAMSDIDLEVRAAISSELDENPDDIHSMRFVNNLPGCVFVVEAKVYNNSCKVCFEGSFKSPYAAETICERIWLQSEDEI